MLKVGTILYFNSFQFKNGKPSKAKYFIVLAITQDKTVVATLPSSQNFVPPDGQGISHGCVDIASANFNCYVFTEGRSVTTNRWAFPLRTFVYGQQLDEYDISDIQSRYPVEGLDYEIKGELTPEELRQLITCLAASPSVKRKYRKILQ